MQVQVKNIYIKLPIQREEWVLKKGTPRIYRLGSWNTVTKDKYIETTAKGRLNP